MIAAALALAALLGAAQADDPRAGALEELRELAELDLPAELVPRGRELVAPGGLLARSGEARALVAAALFAAGAEEEAFGLLDPADAEPGDRPWLELQRARLLLARDDLAGAARLLRAPPSSAGDAPPDAPPDAFPEAPPVRHAGRPEAWILLARVEARAGRGREAALLARAFLERSPLHPEAPTAWHLLAQDALARRDGEAAGRFLERARGLEQWLETLRARRLQVRRSPDEPLPRLGLGLAWMQVGEHERARAVLADLVGRHPDFARGAFHLGEALRLLGDLEGARAAYGRAVASDPDMHLARYNRALVDLLGARPDEARGDLERLAATEAVAGDPRFAGVFLHLARLDLAAGNGSGAADRYAEYRRLGGTEPLE